MLEDLRGFHGFYIFIVVFMLAIFVEILILDGLRKMSIILRILSMVLTQSTLVIISIPMVAITKIIDLVSEIIKVISIVITGDARNNENPIKGAVRNSKQPSPRNNEHQSEDF